MESATTIVLLDGEMRIEARGAYLHVWHGRSARDVEELEGVLEAIERAMRAGGVRRLLFDSRDSDLTPRDVGERLWAWLHESRLERVGTLVTSVLLQTSVRMNALSRRVNIRSFDDEAAADAWMREGARGSFPSA